MSKAEDRRAELVERMADHVLAHGLTSASLRPLARAAGTSDRMLLYYFKDKAEIMRAVAEHVAARFLGMIDQRVPGKPQSLISLRRQLAELMFSPEAAPIIKHAQQHS